MTSEASPRTLILTGVEPHTSLPQRIATTFIDAGFKNIGLLGSTEATLQRTRDSLIDRASSKSVNILPQVADITSPESVGLASHQIRGNLGAWDVFIHCASPFLDTDAPTAPRTTIRGSDEDDWWQVFERNVKSLHHIARHFFSKMKANAVFINLLSVDLSDGGCDDKNAAEWASQLAAAKVIEYLGKENESSGVRIVNVYVPGPQLRKGASVEDFLLWCTSSEVSFLNGKTVNGDLGVEGLSKLRSHCERDLKSLTAGVQS